MGLAWALQLPTESREFNQEWQMLAGGTLPTQSTTTAGPAVWARAGGIRRPRRSSADWSVLEAGVVGGGGSSRQVRA